MYESFFNLSAKPFDLLPNPEFLFLSKTHKRALSYLDYAIRERAGFILLSGEIGSGKTTIIRDLIKKHREGVVLSKVFNTKVSFEHLLAMVNEDFGIRPSGGNKTTLLRELNEFLIDQFGKGNRAILIIDEAQNLSPEALEEIRMLSNLETDTAKLLQIILVGQPELRRILALPELLQLRQRISFYCHIKPLAPQEVEQYILHRLEVAGNRNAIIMPSDVVAIIWQYSRGIPRLINILCDFLLLAAFAEEARELTADFATEVIGELDFDNEFWRDGKPDGEEIASPRPEGTNDLMARLVCRISALENRDPFPQSTADDVVRRMDQLDRTVRDYMHMTTNAFEKLKSEVWVKREVLAGQNVEATGPAHGSGKGEKKKGLLRYLFREV